MIKQTLSVVAGAVGVGIIVIVAMWLLRPATYPLPAGIKNQVDFSVYFPLHGAAGFKLKPDTAKISQAGDAKVFNFVLTAPGQEVTISEQAYPEILIYDKFTASLNPEGQIGTAIGSLTIGHPKDAHGQQVVGMRANDTLVLGKPAKAMTSTQWRDLINSLELVK